MRRLLVYCLVALFGLPLLAATPAISIKPNVIVYPLISNGSSVDREASSRLATIIATEMANTNTITVIPPPPGTERKDYLSVARAHDADYYVSGFISPLGNGVSVVLQVVSTTTGIVVFSQSAQLNSYGDAAGPGNDLAVFISRHANRGLAAVGTPPPQASASPQPSGGPEANLGRLFGRRPKKTPAPKASGTPKPATAVAPTGAVTVPTAPAAALTKVTPAPAARPAATPAAVAQASVAPRTAAAATPVYVVLTVAGSADAALRELATQRIVSRIHGERAQTAVQGCATVPTRAVLSGTLTVRPDPQVGGGSASFELTASDCAGKVLWHEVHANDARGAQGQQVAVERAVDSALGGYLSPPRRRR